VHSKRGSEVTDAEEMVKAFSPRLEGNVMSCEELELRIVHKGHEDKNNRLEYPTVKERRMKEKKLRPLGLNTNHVLNFESSFDQPATGNFFNQNGNSAVFVTHSSDHRRPE
jgi:hypothetical protein